jgi:hypothetical protein
VRSLIDVVAARTFGPLSLNLNVDYIHESASLFYDNYFGVGLMGKYIVNDNFALAARGEYVEYGTPPAIGGITPTRVHFEEFTITGIIPLGGRMEIRPEFRGDFSNVNDFNTTAVPADPKKSQFTGTLAFLAWF